MTVCTIAAFTKKFGCETVTVSKNEILRLDCTNNFKQREFLQLQLFFFVGVAGSFCGEAVDELNAEIVIVGADCCCCVLRLVLKQKMRYQFNIINSYLVGLTTLSKDKLSALFLFLGVLRLGRTGLKLARRSDDLQGGK
jgi:hypothetical protein